LSLPLEERPYRGNCDTVDYTSLGLTKPLAEAGLGSGTGTKAKRSPRSEVSWNEGFYANNAQKTGLVRSLQEKPQQDDDGNWNPEHPQKHSA
jgi:hypothetical protein